MVAMVKGVGRTPGSLRGVRAEGEREPEAKIYKSQSPMGNSKFGVKWGAIPLDLSRKQGMRFEC